MLPERLAQACAALQASLTLHDCDACALSLADGSQDVVLVSTVFGSLLDDAFQRRRADTMWRRLRPGGALLWYDVTVDNLANRDVRGAPLARVQQLPTQGRFDAQRFTLALPIARRVVRVSPALHIISSTLPALRTPVLAWIAKPLP